jgi:hypothetical protein
LGPAANRHEGVRVSELTVRELKLPDLSTCWALVERVAASSQLKRATRLRDLVLFVGRRHLKEGCDQIHEQQIGVEVFGRPASYDTNVDNIVRANVSELRKRIDAYFEGEGRDETLIMEIPRGSYVPVFRYRPAAHEIAPEPPEGPAAAQTIGTSPSLSNTRSFSIRRGWSRSGFAASLVILILSSACFGLWVQNRAMQRSLDATERAFYPWKQEPTVAAFWSTFLDSTQDTDVIVPDASFSQIQYYSQTSIPLQNYIDRSYIGQLESQNLNPDVRTLLNSFSSLNFVTLSTIKMAQNILSLDPLGRKMHMYFSREYIPAFIDRDNVILLGDPRSNPWVQLLENRLNFSEDRENGHLGPVINHAPAPGEQASYIKTDSVGYCVVAFLPNPGHTGKFLLIQGTSPAATQAAEFFLLSETQLSSFRNKLNARKFPYFEVLLKTSQVTGTPLTATVEAYRVYSDQ